MKRNILAWILAVIMILSYGITVEASENNWDVISGFGSVKATGEGLTKDEEGNVTLNGYGGLFYDGKAVHDAVAVQFQIQAYPAAGYYFYFGLLDSKQSLWNASASKAQGMISRVTVADKGAKLNLLAVNKTSSEAVSINTEASELKAMGIPHMLAMYKEAGNWIYAIDGAVVARVPASSVNLEDSSYLTAGSFGSSSMEMTIHKIFIDDEVTSEIKDGTYIKEVAGSDASINVYYDDEGKLILGETSKASVLSYEQPKYVISELAVKNKNNIWLTVALGCGAGIAVVMSFLMFYIEKKKKKKACAQEGE